MNESQNLAGLMKKMISLQEKEITRTKKIESIKSKEAVVNARSPSIRDQFETRHDSEILSHTRNSVKSEKNRDHLAAKNFKASGVQQNQLLKNIRWLTAAQTVSSAQARLSHNQDLKMFKGMIHMSEQNYVIGNQISNEVLKLHSFLRDESPKELKLRQAQMKSDRHHDLKREQRVNNAFKEIVNVLGLQGVDTRGDLQHAIESTKGSNKDSALLAKSMLSYAQKIDDFDMFDADNFAETVEKVFGGNRQRALAEKMMFGKRNGKEVDSLNSSGVIAKVDGEERTAMGYVHHMLKLWGGDGNDRYLYNPGADGKKKVTGFDKARDKAAEHDRDDLAYKILNRIPGVSAVGSTGGSTGGSGAIHPHLKFLGPMKANSDGILLKLIEMKTQNLNPILEIMESIYSTSSESNARDRKRYRREIEADRDRKNNRANSKSSSLVDRGNGGTDENGNSLLDFVGENLGDIIVTGTALKVLNDTKNKNSSNKTSTTSKKTSAKPKGGILKKILYSLVAGYEAGDYFGLWDERDENGNVIGDTDIGVVDVATAAVDAAMVYEGAKWAAGKTVDGVNAIKNRTNAPKLNNKTPSWKLNKPNDDGWIKKKMKKFFKSMNIKDLRKLYQAFSVAKTAAKARAALLAVPGAGWLAFIITSIGWGAIEYFASEALEESITEKENELKGQAVQTNSEIAKDTSITGKMANLKQFSSDGIESIHNYSSTPSTPNLSKVQYDAYSHHRDMGNTLSPELKSMMETYEKNQGDGKLQDKVFNMMATPGSAYVHDTHVVDAINNLPSIIKGYGIIDDDLSTQYNQKRKSGEIASEFGEAKGASMTKFGWGLFDQLPKGAPDWLDKLVSLIQIPTAAVGTIGYHLQDDKGPGTGYKHFKEQISAYSKTRWNRDDVNSAADAWKIGKKYDGDYTSSFSSDVSNILLSTLFGKQAHGQGKWDEGMQLPGVQKDGNFPSKHPQFIYENGKKVINPPWNKDQAILREQAKINAKELQHIQKQRIMQDAAKHQQNMKGGKGLLKGLDKLKFLGPSILVPEFLLDMINPSSQTPNLDALMYQKNIKNRDLAPNNQFAGGQGSAPVIINNNTNNNNNSSSAIISASSAHAPILPEGMMGYS